MPIHDQDHAPTRDRLRDELVAELAVLMLMVDVVRQAEKHDSPALSELACLIAAMHAQLTTLGPRHIRRAWDFVEALRDIHRGRDGRFASLAGYLRARGESLVELIAPTNLHACPDGSLSCDSLGALEGAEVN